MSERISPWAFVPAAAMLIGAALFFAAPWSDPAESQWSEVNDSVAQLLAQDAKAAEEAVPIGVDAAKANTAAERTTTALEAVKPEEKSTMSPEAVKTEEKAENEGLININTASAAELDSLQGIGPSKAAAIIAYREENGPFDSIEAVMNVKGIGEKMFAKIKDRITTSGGESD